MTGLKDTDKNKEWQFAALLLSGASLAISSSGGPRRSSHGSLWNYANVPFDAAVDAPGANLSPKRSDGLRAFNLHLNVSLQFRPNTHL